ncbi:prepilin peptidase [Leucobacter chinensis]|uniref:prepilin peptidase n=1 Tax=Leucobacter chinensis TaxID=2851010 RepID=UPI001C23D62E|nr:A24 family peptidase [Leucobacter chinensis]
MIGWALGAVLTAIAVVIAVIDQRTMRIPNLLVLPATVFAWVVAGVTALGEADAAPLIRTVMGGLALFTVWYLVALASRGSLGGGDVKFAGYLGSMLGLYGGYGAVLVGGFAMFLAGGLAAAAALLFGRAKARISIPFAPWMLVGAGFALFWAVH